FDGVIVPYEFDDLDELVPAYAISIHKSQGSEYPAVVIPLMMQHYILLQRNLIYTAITRGKKLVVLVGETRALEIAIKNDKTCRRYTRLANRLAESGGF
ncbi:MAG: ATP-binding domain-containing protein, partial [Desulfovibrio sp.]|nr:ATP-binding domain-containing protein [Desulfovibrio sp.]